MFKFLKSKKGFTLVELMIVVVIMAILVAVAVPIYSAVTNNARKKTCIGNQREIISSIGNWLMLQDNNNIAGTLKTTGGSDAPAWDTAATNKIEVTAGSTTTDVTAQIKALFKTVPVCPDAANNITITVTAGTGEAVATVSTECDNAEHVIPGQAA